MRGAGHRGAARRDPAPRRLASSRRAGRPAERAVLITPPDNPFVSSPDPERPAGLGVRAAQSVPLPHRPPRPATLFIARRRGVALGGDRLRDRGGLELRLAGRGGSGERASDSARAPPARPLDAAGLLAQSRRARERGDRQRRRLSRAGGATDAFPAEYEGDCFFSEFYSGALCRLSATARAGCSPRPSGPARTRGPGAWCGVATISSDRTARSGTAPESAQRTEKSAASCGRRP